MITAKTPGAYRLDRGGKSKGFTKRITKEQVDELRAQGKSWAEIAGLLNIPKPALYRQWWRWNQKAKNQAKQRAEEAKAPQEGARGG